MLVNKRDLILKTLQNKELTANEVIERVFKKDVRNGEAISRGWRFYVHMNKLFAPMKREGLINQVGEKSVNGRSEKVWRLR